MNFSFITGVACAILAGSSSSLGQILQKKAVNQAPPDLLKKHKIKYLLKRPVWITGVFLFVGLPAVFYMISESLLGPVLVPGIMTSGLIVLVIGSAKIVHEKISAKEIIGIIILAAGTLFITASHLVISYKNIDLTQERLILRISIFTILTILLWFFSIS